MPTYQYACTECGHAFEQVQSFSEDSLTVCPQCQGRLRKVFNAVGVVFKGSGFYRTDSRQGAGSSNSSSSSNSSGASGSTDAGSSSGSSGSTEKGSSEKKSSSGNSSGNSSGSTGSSSTAAAS